MNDRLNPDEALTPGQELVSANKRATFVLQGDGNLVLYVARPGGRIARWASDTAGQPSAICSMQSDGNLVIYDAASNPLWSSKTASAGSSLVVQDDENTVIYAADGSAQWSTESWVGGWIDSSFDIASSGLRFTNDFPDADIVGIKLYGLCGGMSFTTLDYHFAGMIASRINSPPSTDHSPLGAYILARHLHSLTGIVGTYNLSKFISLQIASDQDLRHWSFHDEFPKIKATIDGGSPVPIGLISKGGGLTDAHQVVAIGYRDGPKDRWLRVFDQNYPGEKHTIWFAKDRDCEQSNGLVWRGFFMESYMKADPPRVGISESTATDRRVFDASLYLKMYGDLAAAFGNDLASATNHWLVNGTREGRRGNAVFDPAFYFAQHADLVAAFRSDDTELAIGHWINNGIGEGRRAALEFDVSWYLANHSDLVDAFGAGNYAAALDHWLDNGIAEGRRSSADFDLGFYLNHHADLQEAFGPANYGAALQHWFEFGKSEGRAHVA